MQAACDIFLSYNRGDQLVAQRFLHAFKALGFTVWWDAALRSGEAYDEVTEAALRAAKAVVVLWSKRSVESRWVRAEATLADRNKTLVPTMIESCERPIMFELVQTADLVHWDGSGDDKAWLGFVGDVRQFVDRLAPAVTQSSATLLQPASLELHENWGAVPSLAVLPFANRSGLAEDEVFAIGMGEDITQALSQGAHLRVVSSASTQQYSSSALPDLATLGRQLGVRYLLEGNVRRIGDELKVTVQLIEAETAVVLWSRKFGRKLADLAELQEDLVFELAAHLDVQVQRIEMARALQKPADLSAWEAVIRAFANLHHASAKDVSLQIDESERATAIAPEYAPAHAMLAQSLAIRYCNHSFDDPAEVDRIRGHVSQALALDRASAFVVTHAAQGLNLIGFADQGLRHSQRAIEISPGMAFAHHACGTALTLLDRSDEAIAHFEAEMKASPGAHTHYLSLCWQANAHFRAGRRVEAEAAVDRSRSLNPDYNIGIAIKALLCLRGDREDEARAVFSEARRLEPEVSESLWELRVCRRFSGSPIANEAAHDIARLSAPD